MEDNRGLNQLHNMHSIPSGIPIQSGEPGAPSNMAKQFGISISPTGRGLQSGDLSLTTGQTLGSGIGAQPGENSNRAHRAKLPSGHPEQNQAWACIKIWLGAPDWIVRQIGSAACCCQIESTARLKLDRQIGLRQIGRQIGNPNRATGQSG